jgi:hypothetical protein
MRDAGLPPASTTCRIAGSNSMYVSTLLTGCVPATIIRSKIATSPVPAARLVGEKARSTAPSRCAPAGRDAAVRGGTGRSGRSEFTPARRLSPARRTVESGQLSASAAVAVMARSRPIR